MPPLAIPSVLNLIIVSADPVPTRTVTTEIDSKTQTFELDDLLEPPQEVVERVPTLTLYAPPEGQKVEEEQERTSPPYYVLPMWNNMSHYNSTAGTQSDQTTGYSLLHVLRSPSSPL
ncbi:hypothetical protein BJ742DRAFT_736565 [Cladochytrium replicatum]|nr:hypothetical protein BJ742DRAFT_736565 [Cladochytrium replicatum]